MAASPQSSTRKDLFTENDVNSHKQGVAGYGIYSGLAATPGTGLTVSVAAGSVYFAGTKVTKSTATTVTLTAASATLPRRDIIVIDSAGTISAVDGAPAIKNSASGSDTRFQFFAPYPPVVPSGKILICEVYVDAAATGLVAADILDKRVIMDPDVVRPGENIVLKAGVPLNIYSSDGVTLLFTIDPSSGRIGTKGGFYSL